MQACLRRDETQRPTAEQLLQHPWLQDDCDVSDAPFDDTIVQRLQRYGLYGRFRQVALRALIGSLAEGGASAGAGAAGASSSQTAAPQLAVMRAAFERLDRDGDGRVTYAEVSWRGSRMGGAAAPAAASGPPTRPHATSCPPPATLPASTQLRDALQDPGHFKLSAGEVEQLLGQVSLASDGTIAWEEWVAAMADWRVVSELGGRAGGPGGGQTCSAGRGQGMPGWPTRGADPASLACPPTPRCSPQLQGSEDWDRLVGRAFASLDPNGDGVISAEELEALLCGPTGCEVRCAGCSLGARRRGACARRLRVCSRRRSCPPRPAPRARLPHLTPVSSHTSHPCTPPPSLQFPDEVEAALREADRDHDGTISEQDFRAFLDAATDDRLDLFDARVSRDGAGSGSDGSGSDAPGKSGGPGPADG